MLLNNSSNNELFGGPRIKTFLASPKDASAKKHLNQKHVQTKTAQELKKKGQIYYEISTQENHYVI